MGYQATQPAKALVNERRRYPRQAVIGPELISVDVGPDDTFGLMTNLSEEGAALQTFAPLQPGSTKTLRWKFSSEDEFVEVRAEVVWSYNRMSGMRFLDLTANARSRLARWLESFASVDLPSPGSDSIGPMVFGDVPSVDFELDILVRRARSLTRADGAAIAIQSSASFVCRASRGSAPGVGVVLQVDTGLSREAVRTGQTTICADTETDPRVDAEVCRELNVRSVVVVPIKHADQVVGILECLWSGPQASFSEAVSQLAAIAETVVALLYPDETLTIAELPAPLSPGKAGSESHLDVASTLLPPPGANGLETAMSALVSPPATDTVLAPPASPWMAERGEASATSAGTSASEVTIQKWAPAIAASSTRRYVIAAVVVLAAAVFGLGLYVWRSKFVHAPAPAPPVTQTAQPSEQAAVPAAAQVAAPANTAPAQPAPSPTKATPKVKQGADEDDEVVISRVDQVRSAVPLEIRSGQPREEQPEALAPPALVEHPANGQTLKSLTSTSASMPALAPATPNSSPPKLLRKVQPRYPHAAATQRISGTVVLEAVISKEGKVTRVQVVSGHPLLVDAARIAVLQWRYKPAEYNGQPVEGAVQVAVNFTGRR